MLSYHKISEAFRRGSNFFPREIVAAHPWLKAVFQGIETLGTKWMGCVDIYKDVLLSLYYLQKCCYYITKGPPNKKANVMRKGHFCLRPAFLLNQEAVRQISYINWPEKKYVYPFCNTILLFFRDVQNRITNKKMTIILWRNLHWKQSAWIIKAHLKKSLGSVLMQWRLRSPFFT